MISLNRLFHPHKAPRDGLTQGQREAIIDLLNYCSFVDHDLAASEGDLIDKLESQFHWDASIDFDYYVNQSVGAVRNVIESEDSRDAFLKNIKARLDSQQSRTIALNLADKLFRADGRVTPEESETLQAIRKNLG